MATTADPVRERVEATLHQIVDTATAVPCDLVRRVRRTISEPVAFARTMVNLTLGGVLGWDLDGDSDGQSKARSPARPDTVEHSPARATGPTSAESSTAAGLAIDDYENLAASNIVARLDRLDRVELEEIKEFELDNRGRRTVVGKIDQLLLDR